MNKTKDSIMGWLSVNGTYLYILIMLIAFPLFNTQKMFDLDADKTNFFLNITILYACIILFAAFKAVLGWRQELPSLKAAFEKPDIIFAAILLTAIILSTIFALDIKKSFFGLVSRDVSSLCFLLCVMVYFAVRQYGMFDGIVLWGWLIGSTIIYLIGICCACGINFMHIQDGLIPSELGVFLTPLSNINCNTCYVCLALPPVIIMYMTCKEHFSQLLHGINVYMGFLFIYFIKTDSAILVFIAGILILGYFALEKQIWAERYIQITGIYLGAKVTIRILLYFFENKLLPFYGTTHLWLLSNKVLITELACYLFFFAVWKWKKTLIREKLAFIRKYIVITAAAAAALLFICIIYANVKAPSISENSLLKRLV